MDSLTHLTLGACTGELILGKKLGKKAMLWGALAQSFPDIDTLTGNFYPADEGYLIHRGLTHSLPFAVVVGLLLAGIASRVHRKELLGFGLLAVFFVSELGLHDLLDTCNAYGTGLFEPFTHQRFSFNLLFVADPLFTISLLIVTLLLIYHQSTHLKRTKWVWRALAVSVVYLCFAICCKLIVDHRVETEINAQHIGPADFFTTPAPLTSMLWYTVARHDSSFYTGYRSVWDHQPEVNPLEQHLQNTGLLKNEDPRLVHNLIAFAENDYVLTRENNITYLNILRFEQAHGWAVNDAPFMFSYPLSGGADQSLLLQKGRLHGWNKKTIRRYLERIAGHQRPLK